MVSKEELDAVVAARMAEHHAALQAAKIKHREAELAARATRRATRDAERELGRLTQQPRQRGYVPDDLDGQSPEHRWLVEGSLNLRLVPYVDKDGFSVLRLAERTGLLLGPTNRHLPAIGLWSTQIRGVRYREQACRDGDFSLRAPLVVRREPDNQYDAFAVAVLDRTGRHLCGYYNSGKARLMSRAMDAGQEMQAVSMRGEPAGVGSPNIHALAGPPELVVQVLAPWPSGWTQPYRSAPGQAPVN